MQKINLNLNILKKSNQMLLLSLFLFLTLFINNNYADNEKIATLIKVDFGLQRNMLFDPNFPYGGISYGLSIINVNNKFKTNEVFRFFYNQELINIASKTPPVISRELGYLWGYYFENDLVFMNCGYGISLISGRKYFDLYRDQVKDYLTIGIPLEAQIVFKITSAFGLGIGMFSNLNPEDAYYGYLISFLFPIRIPNNF